ECVPRLPGAARVVGAADRGAGGVLARPGPRRARVRRRRRRPGRDAPGPGVSRLAVLVRVPGMSEPGGPRETGAVAEAGTDRRTPIGGAAVAPGTIHRRPGGAPPRREIFQRIVSARRVLLIM